jgi:hypothetical protein
MFRYRKTLITLILFIILAYTISSNAEEGIEDLIDIAVSKSKVIAVINGEQSIPVTLRQNEKVLWSDSSGNLGAFLTDSRFFVISTTSGTWHGLRLNIDEPEKAIASLSPFMVLLVTGERAIGYSALTDKFVKKRLPLFEELIAAETGRYVAVVITSSRALGLGVKSSSFIEVRIRIKETVEEIKATFSKVTVRTSDRLLSFVADSFTWKEHRIK